MVNIDIEYISRLAMIKSTIAPKSPNITESKTIYLLLQINPSKIFSSIIRSLILSILVQFLQHL